MVELEDENNDRRAEIAQLRNQTDIAQIDLRSEITTAVNQLQSNTSEVLAADRRRAQEELATAQECVPCDSILVAHCGIFFYEETQRVSTHLCDLRDCCGQVYR